MSLLATLRLEWEDRLRYSSTVRNSLSRLKLLRDRAPDRSDPQAIARSIDHLAQAARLATSDDLRLPIEALVRERLQWLGPAKINWKEFERTADKRHIEKAAVLKPCLGEKEKGVVYISFEYQWIRLLQHCDLRAFAQRYHLVVSPVWACPYSLVNFYLPFAHPGPLFTHLSDPNDQVILPRLGASHVLVPALCSSWITPELYHPLPFEKKDIDIFMLANFGKYKRHFSLFKALRDMPRTVRVRLIGQRNGPRTAEVLRAEARAYGVEDRFELLESVPDQTVLDSFARSKISIILSKREGSCVAVVESFFANTPVGLLEGAEVGSRMYLNEQTGRFLREDRLAADLMDFLDQASRYQPRQWALDHGISCHGSCRTLNRILKETTTARGDSWTQDIAPFTWRPNPKLLDPRDYDRLQPAYEDIKQRFGLEIGTGL